MAGAEATIAKVTPVENVIKGAEWMRAGDEMKCYRKTIITLGRECRDWCNGRADLEINQLIADNSTDDDVIIYRWIGAERIEIRLGVFLQC